MIRRWHAVAATIAAGAVFGAGMATGARIERAGSEIQWRAAINRCEEAAIGDFVIVPDKQCRKGGPVNYIFMRRTGTLTATQ